MDTELNPFLAALALFVILPMLLWVEATLWAPRWFKTLASVLIGLWSIPLLAITIGESLCEGSAVKGFSRCKGPFGPDFYEALVASVPLLPLVFAVYVGALVARFIESRKA